MKTRRQKAGFWLLISLIPTGVLGFVSLVIGAANTTEGEVFSNGWEIVGIIGVLTFWPYWWIALIVGVTLMVLAHSAAQTAEKEGQRYGEQSGWLQISKASWKSFKPDGVVLSVNPNFGNLTYTLTIESTGETVTVEGFETPRFALQFGDHVWEKLLSEKPEADASVVHQKLGEWETALAIHRKGP